MSNNKTYEKWLRLNGNNNNNNGVEKEVNIV